MVAIMDDLEAKMQSMECKLRKLEAEWLRMQVGQFATLILDSICRKLQWFRIKNYEEMFFRGKIYLAVAGHSVEDLAVIMAVSGLSKDQLAKCVALSRRRNISWCKTLQDFDEFRKENPRFIDALNAALWEGAWDTLVALSE